VSDFVDAKGDGKGEDQDFSVKKTQHEIEFFTSVESEALTTIVGGADFSVLQTLTRLCGEMVKFVRK